VVKCCMITQSYLDGKSSANKAGVVAKRSHAPACCVLEELEVIQRASTAGKPRQDLLPAALLLVAVRKVDKGVLERKLVFGQFLQADDDAVLGCRLVSAFLDERRAGLLELLVLEDARIVGVLGAALDEHWVAGVEELLGRGGGQAGAVLERLGLSAGVEGGERHGGRRAVCKRSIAGREAAELI
jgi:hypothetical protein